MDKHLVPRIGGQFLDAGGATFNVRHPLFGATGDGTADDTGAIQAAIDAAYDAGGGTVLVPNGVYLYSHTIFLRSHVHLAGQSWGAILRPRPGLGDEFGTGLFRTLYAPSSIRRSDGTSATKSADLATYRGAHRDICVRNLKLEGTVHSTTPGQRIGRNCHVISLEETTDCLIERVWIDGAEDAAIMINGAGPTADYALDLDGLIATQAEDTSNVTIRDCKTTEAYFGVEVARFVKDIRIVDNRFLNCWAHGIRFHGGQDGLIEGNTVLGDSGYLQGDGLYLDRAHRVSVRANTLMSRRAIGPSATERERAVRVMEALDTQIEHNTIIQGHIAHVAAATPPRRITLRDNHYLDRTGLSGNTLVVSGRTYEYGLIPLFTFAAARGDAREVFVDEIVPDHGEGGRRKTYSSGPEGDLIRNRDGTAIRFRNGMQVAYNRVSLGDERVRISSSRIRYASTLPAPFAGDFAVVPIMGIDLTHPSVVSWRGHLTYRAASPAPDAVDVDIHKPAGVPPGFDDESIEAGPVRRPAEHGIGFIAVGLWR